MAAGPAFPPDSALAAVVRPSPNHGERAGGRRPDAIVLHYTGMRDGPSAVERLCDPAAEVSCHYVVTENGTALQLVPEARRAWHAGRSSWRGEADLNSASIGIEIVNGGHDYGLPPFPDPQIEAVVALCRDLMARHGIAPGRVLAHSDLAPGRKVDPGERFPWERLAAAGVVLWVPPSDDPSREAGPGDAGAVRAGLARLGYGFGDETSFRDAVAAFQRRHRPARVDGVPDPGTRDTLERLLALTASAGPAALPGGA